MKAKVGVAVLGATGAVGQQFVRFLAENDLLEIRVLTASEQKIGKPYGDQDTTAWYADTKDVPESARNIPLSETNIEAVRKAGGVRIIFSALPADISKPLELQAAKEGYWVISKASSFRENKFVPLLVPEVNLDHLKLLDVQRKEYKFPGNGAIISDPNCTTSGLVLGLKPILDGVGLKRVLVTSLQAMSGAGYIRGLSPIAIMDNVLPFIEKEEHKLETETLKIFGNFSGSEIQASAMDIHASCVRIPVDYGHMEDIYFETEESTSEDELKKMMRNFRGEPQKLNLPHAPAEPIVVKEQKDRPQPKLDVNINDGMSVVVGRVRKQGDGYRMMLLVHNTVRGGAGMAVLNAELLVAKKLIDPVLSETIRA